MGEDSVEFGEAPFTPAGREENGRAERAHRDGDGNEFGFGEAGSESQGGGEYPRNVRDVNGLCPPYQTAPVREADEEAREKNRGDGEIDCGREDSPRNGRQGSWQGMGRWRFDTR